MELTPEQLERMKQGVCKHCGQPLEGVGYWDCPVIHKYDFEKYQFLTSERLNALEAENKRLAEALEIYELTSDQRDQEVERLRVEMDVLKKAIGWNWEESLGGYILFLEKVENREVPKVPITYELTDDEAEVLGRKE